MKPNAAQQEYDDLVNAILSGTTPAPMDGIHPPPLAGGGTKRFFSINFLTRERFSTLDAAIIRHTGQSSSCQTGIISGWILEIIIKLNLT
jgi:hypothetical protein